VSCFTATLTSTSPSYVHWRHILTLLDLLFTEPQNTTTKLSDTHTNAPCSFDTLFRFFRVCEKAFNGGVIVPCIFCLKMMG